MTTEDDATGANRTSMHAPDELTCARRHRACGWDRSADAAVEAVLEKRWGMMVSARGVAPACQLALAPLSDAVRALNLVDVERFYDTEHYRVKRRVLG